MKIKRKERRTKFRLIITSILLLCNAMSTKCFCQSDSIYASKKNRLELKLNAGVVTDYYAIVDKLEPYLYPSWHFQIYHPKSGLGLRLTKVHWFSIERNDFQYPRYYIDNYSASSYIELTYDTRIFSQKVTFGSGYVRAWPYRNTITPNFFLYDYQYFIPILVSLPVSWLNLELRTAIPLKGYYDHTVTLGAYYEFDFKRRKH